MDINGEVSEDFVGFTEGEDLTGRGLANHLLSQVKELGLNINNCRGQGYDGAAAMQGKLNGCQAMIREKEALAVYVHCYLIIA